MAGEAIVKWGTQKTLEASGGAISTNAVVQANDATYSLSADAAYYPDAEFVLAAQFSVAPTEGGALGLYARPLNIDGTAWFCLQPQITVSTTAPASPALNDLWLQI